MTTAHSLTSALHAHISKRITAAGGWIGFDEFMALALYTPGHGYYASDSTKFGAMPYQMEEGERVQGSDFVTAPEMTPLYGMALASQVAQALQATQTDELWEFGAGSGALALQLLTSLEAMRQPVLRYNIVDLSGSLRQRQAKTLAKYADRVRWHDALPEELQGVVVGNEVLDAMPVKLLVRLKGVWHERGVSLNSTQPELGVPDGTDFVWSDRVTALRPACEIGGQHDFLTEIHPQAEAFVRTLADRLARGAVFLIDYGFAEHEYYHEQRHMGTLMCHRSHRADTDPLVDVGLKDITAHVNFTGIAQAAQEAHLGLLGYCTQARFLLNCGLADLLEAAPLAQRVRAQALIMEHEMGELFKVIGWVKGEAWDALGFSQGDRSHRL